MVGGVAKGHTQIQTQYQLLQKFRVKAALKMLRSHLVLVYFWKDILEVTTSLKYTLCKWNSSSWCWECPVHWELFWHWTLSVHLYEKANLLHSTSQLSCHTLNSEQNRKRRERDFISISFNLDLLNADDL